MLTLDDQIYYQKSAASISPLSSEFNKSYFERLLTGLKPKLSVKMLLAAEQGIPGLGNGVLQDILFHAKINPKREIGSLTSTDKSALLRSIKTTLKSMVLQGGRDAETDLFGKPGNYKTILSRTPWNTPCPSCSNPIIKDTSNGGTVYYCPVCQKI